MKRFALAFAGLMLFGVQAHAHKVSKIRQAKAPAMEAARNDAQAFANLLNKRYEGNGGGTVYAGYKIVEIKPGRKAGESEVEMYKRVVKGVLHRDHPITGDDGGYSFDQVTVAGKFEKALPARFGYELEEESEIAAQQKVVASFSKAIEAGMTVLIGEGSGNNTIAYILIVIDPKNNEFFYVMDSNFGSDN